MPTEIVKAGANLLLDILKFAAAVILTIILLSNLGFLNIQTKCETTSKDVQQ